MSLQVLLGFLSGTFWHRFFGFQLVGMDWACPDHLKRKKHFEMVDIGPNLDSVVRELHEIFSEPAVEKDLSTIKRIKKIVSDSHQIVTNRENEIKEVVKGKAIHSHLNVIMR